MALTQPTPEHKMNEFLKLEYEKCLELLKFYDERHLSLLKFSTGVSSSVMSLIFGFHAVREEAHPYFWHFTAVLAAVTGIGLLGMFVAMLRNRLYFVFPARQVNAIRRAMLARIAAEFDDNQMYVNSDMKAFNFFSFHTLLILLVALQVGAFVGLCWFAVTLNPMNVMESIQTALVVAGISAVLLVFLAALYLSGRGGQNPGKPH